jgi:hypothetical protein
VIDPKTIFFPERCAPENDAVRQRPRTRVLLENGRWVVPPEERPTGWESMLPGTKAQDPRARTTAEG